MEYVVQIVLALGAVWLARALDWAWQRRRRHQADQILARIRRAQVLAQDPGATRRAELRLSADRSLALEANIDSSAAWIILLGLVLYGGTGTLWGWPILFFGALATYFHRFFSNRADSTQADLEEATRQPRF